MVIHAGFRFQCLQGREGSTPSSPTVLVIMPEWRNGLRSGLRCRTSQEVVGSTPTSGTKVRKPIINLLSFIYAQRSEDLVMAFDCRYRCRGNNFCDWSSFVCECCLP